MGPNCMVAKSSANGLVGTGCTSRYEILKDRYKATIPSSFLLFSNRVTTNY